MMMRYKDGLKLALVGLLGVIGMFIIGVLCAL